MLLAELFAIAEAIDQTHMVDAWGPLRSAIKQWCQKTYEEIKAEFSLSLDAYDSAERFYDDFYGILRSLRDPSSARHKEMIADLKEVIEITLQDYAREYVERTYGKIEPYDHSEDYERQRKTKNLMGFHHIVVQLDLDRKKRDEDPVMSNGGYFSRFLGRDQAALASNRYVQANVQWDKHLGVLINIYATSESVWEAIDDALSSAAQIEAYGESMHERDETDVFLGDLMPTFVHEMIHLEQEARQQKQHRWVPPQHGITHTPNPDRKRDTVQDYRSDSKRGSDRKNKDTTYRKYHPGRRGNPSRLSKDVNTAAEWTEYYGTEHEINAHAAGVAADVMRDFLSSHRHRHKNPAGFQSAINDHVDAMISDLKNGYGLPSRTFDQYVARMRDRLKEMTIAGLPKADIGYRKAWRRFATKLIAHLEKFKRPIPWGPDDAWRREYHPEPKTGVGGLVHPVEKPKLP